MYLAMDRCRRVATSMPRAFREKCHAGHLQRPAFIAKRLECGSLLPLFDRPSAIPRPKSVGKPRHSKRFATKAGQLRCLAGHFSGKDEVNAAPSYSTKPSSFMNCASRRSPGCADWFRAL
jgi:hypothetical protein